MVTNGQVTLASTAAAIADAIPVALIDPSPLNRHCTDEDADIAALAQTIAENGLFAPISARPRADGRFEIICGERRWRAFRLLERKMIPCFVKDLDGTQAQIERIVENFQRRDPSFLEQGESVAALMKLTDRDVSEVANRLGQSVAWVYRRAKLPNLIPAWREALATENTPYYAIRDSVNKLEELSILPPATQEMILASNALRHIKTIKEMRDIIGKLFMSLDAKPWTREWEKKAYSGSGKKRCDACMKRSDRESALFADPDNPAAGKKMCLDPECWQSKCRSWCKILIADNPGMIPIREGYAIHRENLNEIFGVKPLAPYMYETEAQEGLAAVVGVIVDGANTGTTKRVWIQKPDESDGEDSEDSDVSAVHDWRRNSTSRYQERQELTVLIAADITEYLSDIDTNATTPTAQLAANKLRAAAWFGLPGYAESEEEEIARLGDPEWNPLAWAWGRTIGNIARHVAHAAASDITQTHNGDRDNDVDAANAAALTAMFEIPVDMIATRATDTLYTATRNEEGGTNASDEDTEQADAGDIEPDADSDQDTATDADGTATEDFPEPADPVLAVDAEAMLDPEDAIPVSYLQILANAQ